MAELTRMRPCTSPVQHRYRLDSTPHGGEARDSSGPWSFRRYTDDTAFLVKSTVEAVFSLNSFSETASALGLRVLWPKTKLQNLSTDTQPPAIVVDGNTVDSMDNFIYFINLGSVLSFDGYSHPDINRRIGLASSVMSALESHLEGSASFTDRKTSIYQALVLFVLLYVTRVTRSLKYCMARLKARGKLFVQNVFLHNLTLSHNIPVTDGRTDGRRQPSTVT